MLQGTNVIMGADDILLANAELGLSPFDDRDTEDEIWVSMDLGCCE